MPIVIELLTDKGKLSFRFLVATATPHDGGHHLVELALL